MVKMHVCLYTYSTQGPIQKALLSSSSFLWSPQGFFKNTELWTFTMSFTFNFLRFYLPAQSNLEHRFCSQTDLHLATSLVSGVILSNLLNFSELWFPLLKIGDKKYLSEEHLGGSVSWASNSSFQLRAW